MVRRAKESPVDWAGMEPHYRAGIKSLKQLGAEYGCSDAAIVKHAKINGWARDLAAKIRAKADAKVSASVVSAEVSANRKAREEEVVEANAEVQVIVRLKHRRGLGRLSTLHDSLISELEMTTNNQELFERLGELLDTSGEDQNGRYRQDKLNETYRRVISFSGRVDDMKKLAEINERIRKGEREAFGIDQSKEGEGTYEATLKRVLAAAGDKDS